MSNNYPQMNDVAQGMMALLVGNRPSSTLDLAARDRGGIIDDDDKHRTERQPTLSQKP